MSTNSRSMAILLQYVEKKYLLKHQIYFMIKLNAFAKHYLLFQSKLVVSG